MTDVPLIDSSASLALEYGIKNARAQGRLVFLAGLRREVDQVLNGLDVLDPLSADHRFTTRAAALRAALNQIGPGDTF